MAKNASTHSGHCQACGRLQKLPGGVLSKHGYTVSHGFFSGTCVGSHALPFELSCNLVKGFIESARYQLDNLQEQVEKLNQRPTEPQGWVLNREGYTSNGQIRVWRHVEVNGRRNAYGIVEYFYNAPKQEGGAWGRVVENGEHRIELGYDEASSAARKEDRSVDVAWGMNRDRAKFLQREIQSLRRYIAWQEERVRTWEPRPLLPHNAKDKEGFDPEAR